MAEGYYKSASGQETRQIELNLDKCDVMHMGEKRLFYI